MQLQNAGCFNKCFETNNFTTSYIFLMVRENKHSTEKLKSKRTKIEKRELAESLKVQLAQISPGVGVDSTPKDLLI